MNLSKDVPYNQIVVITDGNDYLFISLLVTSLSAHLFWVIRFSGASYEPLSLSVLVVAFYTCSGISVSLP